MIGLVDKDIKIIILNILYLFSKVKGNVIILRRDMEDIKRLKLGASLVAQWLGVCLLMQGARVRALVWEDPTCRGAMKPVSHDC